MKVLQRLGRTIAAFQYNISQYYEDTIDRRSFALMMLYQLSYQALWELVNLQVRNITVDGEE